MTFDAECEFPARIKIRDKNEAAPASPEEQEVEALIRRMVIAATHTVNNSPVFKRLVEDHALR